MPDGTIRAAGLRLLDWALLPDIDCLPLNVLQGTIVLGAGAVIAVRGYVRAGFRWPADASNNIQKAE